MYDFFKGKIDLFACKSKVTGRKLLIFVEKKRKECRKGKRYWAMESSWWIVEGLCSCRRRLKMMGIQARILHSSNPKALQT
jgi:hypothetical protein